MPNIDPVFVSYYTEEGGYERYLQSHVESMQQFGLEYDIYKLPKPDDWIRGTQLVVPFLKEMLLKHGRPLCYVDIDSIVVDNPLPKLKIASDVGFAAHRVDPKRHAIIEALEGGQRQILSGTLFLQANEGAARFLRAWEGEIKKNVRKHDQDALQKLLDKPQEGFSAEQLHPGLCCIEGDHDFIQDQYIRHLQSSRGFLHPLAIASTDSALKERVEEWGLTFLPLQNTDLASLLELIDRVEIPVLVLGPGAKLLRRPFVAESFAGKVGLAVIKHSDGSVTVSTNTVYLTPTPECRAFLRELINGSSIVELARSLDASRLLERIPASYAADGQELSFVKSPTVSYRA